MPLRTTVTLIAALLIAVATGSSVLLSEQVSSEVDDRYGIGSSEVFLRKYLTYRMQRLRAGEESVLRVRLGYVKGLSRSFTGIAGELAVELDSGRFTLRLNRLDLGQTYSLWLVDEADASVASDAQFKLADVGGDKAAVSLTGSAASTVPFGFSIDRVVLARGTQSMADVLAAGSLSVFQKVFLKRLSIAKESAGAIMFEETRPPAPNLSSLVPDIAADTTAARAISASSATSAETASLAASGSSGPSLLLDVLISQGARLFFEETFGGNGRTCGTCHPASNNLTIDPAFIQTLPANNPLFVAEFNPALAQLERPQLMRSFGLILENVDGLEDPANKFVMRGVPHTLGLQLSLEADTSQVPTPAEMTGWSGDGAPGTGSLHEFAIGAVKQHFTKRLARVEGRDFRQPREHQLDAMEAFQLSLGRDAEFNLATTTFLDAAVESGKSLFVNGTNAPNAGGKCAGCHVNAGAILAGQNRNINTNVEDVVHPARSLQNFPRDGGFGSTPANPDGSFGNGFFNLTSVVEAADTAPFFHNNLASTLEEAVVFYTRPEFNGPRPLTARFAFTPGQVGEISNFMRAINALQNVNVARGELGGLLLDLVNGPAEVQRRLQAAFSETGDAIKVLNQGAIFPVRSRRSPWPDSASHRRNRRPIPSCAAR